MPVGLWPVTSDGKGQIVGVGIGVGVLVGLGVLVGMGVDVGIGVLVGLGVAVGIGIGVLVGTGVEVGIIIIGPGATAGVEVGTTGLATQVPPSQHCEGPQSHAQVRTFRQPVCTQSSAQESGKCLHVPPTLRQAC
jgi:hypothetical protein